MIATDKYTVVVGLGMTGASVARYMRKNGEQFCIMDTRTQPPGLQDIEKLDGEISVFLGDLNEKVLLGADRIIISPGMSREEPLIAAAIEKGIAVVGDIHLFLAEINCPVVGVTGSNGKSTVVELLAEVLRAAGLNVVVGGNIGVPVLDLLEQEFEICILELSSFQLESLPGAQLDVACHLNLSPDHMDRYRSLEHYFRAKQRIFFGAKNVVFNARDPLTVPPVVDGVSRADFALPKRQEGSYDSFWFDAPNNCLMHRDEVLLSYEKMKIRGLHNVENVLAVYAICLHLKVGNEYLARAVASFKGLPHRCQWVSQLREITFINDSKATNVGSTIAAISGLKQGFTDITLIVGGDGKGADFSDLGEVINQEVKTLILLGRDAREIARHVDNSVFVIEAINMQAVVSLALDHTAEGGLVLLSPACASCDMYRDYEDRGEDFIATVEKVCA